VFPESLRLLYIHEERRLGRGTFLICKSFVGVALAMLRVSRVFHRVLTLAHPERFFPWRRLAIESLALFELRDQRCALRSKDHAGVLRRKVLI